MGRIILIGATKGGVGKTVSTYNLAYSLASFGKKILAVDFDSQANLTTCFGVGDTAAVPTTIGHLLMLQLDDEELPDPKEYIMSRNGVDFIPSSMVLSAVDAKLRIEMGAERMLANILEPLRDRYDYLIVDTCPALGALTINALAAADGVVVTVNPQLLAMKGLQDFLKTIQKIKKRINPKLEVEGILLTMCDMRTNLCSVDSIDMAISNGTLKIGEDQIVVQLRPTEQEIIIRDNGTGISNTEAEKVLISIGNSQKTSDSSRGFRGIGRLAALSYCKQLVFQTSYLGESKATIITIDAEKLSELLLDSSDIDVSVVDVLQQVYC